MSCFCQNVKLFVNKLGQLRLVWFLNYSFTKERTNFTNSHPKKPPIFFFFLFPFLFFMNLFFSTWAKGAKLSEIV